MIITTVPDNGTLDINLHGSDPQASLWTTENASESAILIRAFLLSDVLAVQAVHDDEQTQIYFLAGWVLCLAPSSPEKIILYDCPFAVYKVPRALVSGSPVNFLSLEFSPVSTLLYQLYMLPMMILPATMKQSFDALKPEQFYHHAPDIFPVFSPVWKDYFHAILSTTL